jgi:two-component system cell cycle response regulator
VLVTVANLTGVGLRSYDFAARYGGEEFALILPETRIEDAMIVAERLRERIQSHSFSGPLKALKTTVSMGVSTYPATVISSVKELIREADEALYRAKAGGRNRVASMLQE